MSDNPRQAKAIELSQRNSARARSDRSSEIEKSSKRNGDPDAIARSSQAEEYRKARGKKQRKELRYSDLNDPPRSRRIIITAMVQAASETLLFGKKGLGKSTLTEYLCACTITGYARPGEPSTARHPPMTVIYLTAEDDKQNATNPRVQRMAALMCAEMGIDFDVRVRSRFVIVQSCYEITSNIPNDKGRRAAFDLSADVDALRELVADLNKKNPDAPVRLIVVSPITAYIGVKNSNDGAQVRSALEPMASFIEEADLGVLYIGHPRKAGTAGDDAASSVSDTHSGSDQIVNAVRNVFYVMKDPEIMEDGSKSPYSLLLRDKSNLADWNGPWGMKFATIGDTYEGNILDEDGKPKAEGTLRITGVKWIERCDRDPNELIRESRMAERQGADEKWTDAARLMLQTLLAVSPHPVKGDQMKRVAQDAGHAPTSTTWKRAKTWLQNAQLIETGKGPIADWKLGSGCSPLDGDAERLRKAAGHPSTAKQPLAGAEGPPAHFAAIPPADEP